MAGRVCPVIWSGNLYIREYDNLYSLNNAHLLGGFGGRARRLAGPASGPGRGLARGC